MVTHGNLANLVRWHCDVFDVSAGTRSSSLAGIGFDAATWEDWPPLCAGATLVLAPPVAEDTDKLLQWWAQQALHVSFLPTPIAELALRQNIRIPTLRRLLVGGDRLRHRPTPQSPTLINNYGPTEAT